MNEYLQDNVLDNLYTIGMAYDLYVNNFTVVRNKNTPEITETSALLRISKVNNYTEISDFTVTESEFNYGKAIEVESADYFSIFRSSVKNTLIQNADLFVLNMVQKAIVKDMQFDQITKQSDKARYVFSLPSLNLTTGSDYVFELLTFENSQSSFLSVE